MTGAGVDSAVRPDGLAILLQETLTATVRLRSGRQHVADAQSFRAQLREALRIAEQQAGSAGYSAGSFSLAAFAVVAFLDESILNLPLVSRVRMRLPSETLSPTASFSSFTTPPAGEGTSMEALSVSRVINPSSA
jgi:hypothetical protein